MHYRLRNFVKEFVSQDVCLTLGDLVDNLSGIYIIRCILPFDNTPYFTQNGVHRLSIIFNLKSFLKGYVNQTAADMHIHLCVNR